MNHSSPGHTGESSDPYVHGEQRTCSPFHDQEMVSNPDVIVPQTPLTPHSGILNLIYMKESDCRVVVLIQTHQRL